MGESVKLHGSWTSPFVYKIIWALKLKGIPFEFIEEDIFNKSSLLLEYNPIHKKIPVLHDEKPICESTVILEYIEETWPQNPLLPNNPYDRAVARFWVKFTEDKGSCIWPVYRTSGEAQETAIKEGVGVLKIIEEESALAGLGFAGENKFFGGEKIGIVDIAIGSIACWLKSVEEVAGVKLLDEHSFPRLLAWIKNFKEAPVIKENLPDHEKLVAHLKRRREFFLTKP